MNVHKLKFDTSGNVEDITFVLAARNGDKICNITNITDIVVKHCMSEASEFSFNAHKQIGNNYLKCWNDIKNFKLAWIPEWDMWFELYSETDEENESIKNVSGKTIGEAELSQIMLYNIEINTEKDIARDDYSTPTTFYNPNHPEASLVNRLTEKAPHYRFKHIDASLMNIQRTFSFNKKSIYDAFKDIEEELDCLFVFGCGSDENGKPERTISVYDLEANCSDCGHRGTFVDECPKCHSKNITNGYGEYTNIFISKDNLAEEIKYSVDTDSVKNCFKLEAGDDLMTAAIRSCNPNGTDYIYYFSDVTRADMSEELRSKISQYDTLYSDYQNSHNFTLVDSYVGRYNEIVAKYKKYDNTLEEISSPVKGYSQLMNAYFDTIDMVQFLKDKLMPNIDKPENNAKEQGEYLMNNLPSSAATTSLKNLSVSTADNIMVSLAQSIVKGSFKITVTNTTLSNNVWRGVFNLKNYSNEDDTYTSSPVSIGLNENYEEYVKQRIEKILNKSDDNYYDIVGLFKQDLTVFKSELKKYCLDSLNTFQKCCQGCIDIMVQQGVSSDTSATTSVSNGVDVKAIYNDLYVPYYNKLNAIQDEIVVRQNEVYNVEGKYNNQGELVQSGIQNEIEKVVDEVHDTLNFEKYIGENLHKEFCSFIRMDEYSNDNYISDGLNNTELFQNARDFITAAQKEIYKSATLQHSITGTLKNLLRMNEFSPLVDSFKNGNWITVQVDEEIYQLRIIEYTIDFSDTQNIDVVFSDVISLADGVSDIESILDRAATMATSYSGVVRQSEINSNFSKKMSDMITKGLDMTNTKIISSADKQDIMWDEHGLLCREYDDIIDGYNPCQLKIINHGLYLTTDGWKTAKAGVGHFYYFDPKNKAYKEGYGVIADTLVGNLILSSEVGIYNEEKSIELDKNGIVITTNTYGKNAFTIKKELTDDEGNITYERQLYIDDNGNIVLGGGASISWDNVIGTDKDGKSNSMSKLFETLNDTLNEKYNYLLNQDDKKAETWYQSGDPSTAWTTADDKKKHIGDLWYDTKNQKTYIYGAKGWEETKTNPPDSVFDKIDGKAQIFVAQPKPPYAVGDLWFNSKTSDIMTCVKARTTGNFDSTEWEKRNKYTDDSSLTDFINNTYTTDIGNIQDQIDGKIETFRQETDPSTAWTTADDKKKHIGDLWYDTATNETFMYNGAGWSPVAGTVPDEVWGKIDSKCQIFTAQPKPPYNKGDLWFVGSSGDILTCTTARKDGESYVETDWTKQNKYTDDTTANTVKNDILGSTYIDNKWVIAPNIKGGRLLIETKDSSGNIVTSAEITSAGVLKATGAEISGKITATSGTFTNVDIQSGKIGGLKLVSNSIASSNGNFSVTSGGKLTAADADISGIINAEKLYAKQAYYLYDNLKDNSIPIIWASSYSSDPWNVNNGTFAFDIGINKSARSCLNFQTAYSQSFSSCRLYTEQGASASLSDYYYSGVMTKIENDSSGNRYSTIFLDTQRISSSNTAKDGDGQVSLGIANDGTPCFIPGNLLDNSFYSNKIALGTTSHRWKQLNAVDIYVDTIHFPGGTMSAPSSGGGKITNYLAEAESIDYGNAPTVSTSTSSDGKTLTFSFNIPKGKPGAKGEKGATGEKGDPGVVNYGSISKLYNQNANDSSVLTLEGKNPWFGSTSTISKVHLGHDSHRWVNVYYSGRLDGSSDEHLKENITNLSLLNNVEKIYMSLHPISYRFKTIDNDQTQDIHFGFGARETEQIFIQNNIDISQYSCVTKNILESPNIVGDTEEYSMCYLDFIPLNTLMTQKAHHRIDELENEIKELKQIINSLQGVA